MLSKIITFSHATSQARLNSMSNCYRISKAPFSFTSGFPKMKFTSLANKYSDSPQQLFFHTSMKSNGLSRPLVFRTAGMRVYSSNRAFSSYRNRGGLPSLPWRLVQLAVGIFVVVVALKITFYIIFYGFFLGAAYYLYRQSYWQASHSSGASEEMSRLLQQSVRDMRVPPAASSLLRRHGLSGVLGVLASPALVIIGKLLGGALGDAAQASRLTYANTTAVLQRSDLLKQRLARLGGGDEFLFSSPHLVSTSDINGICDVQLAFMVSGSQGLLGQAAVAATVKPDQQVVINSLTFTSPSLGSLNLTDEASHKRSGGAGVFEAEFTEIKTDKHSRKSNK